MKHRAIVWIIAMPAVAMVASAFLLTAVLGPTDNGLRCTRSSGLAACEVRQTRLLGFSGNSSFAIPESSIRGAKAACPTARVGGRGTPSCNVYVSLDTGQDYPVLSYSLLSQAITAATKLNDYLGDKSARSLVIKEDLLTPVLLSAAAPVLFVVAVFFLRRWLRTGSGDLPFAQEQISGDAPKRVAAERSAGS